MASSASKKRPTSPGEQSSQNTKAKRQRFPGQCEWIKSELAWQSWISRDNQSSPILWIHGSAGCGKTFLTHHITDSLQDSNDQLATVSYFCDAYTSPESILRSILNQMAREPKLGREAQILVEESLNGVEEDSTVFKLWDSFSSIVRMDLDVNIIIDGIDEASNHQDFNISGRLAEAIVGKLKRTRLLFSSRTEFKIPSCWEDYAEILITPQKVKEDMERFIESELRRHDILKAFEDEIISKVSERSEGNFLLVNLWITEIALTVKEGDMTSLEEFPSSLDEAYSKIVEQRTRVLSYQDLDIRDHILNWVVAAIRPIRFTELANSTAVATNLFIPTIESKSGELCGSLIKAQDGVLKATHYSFQEFLSKEKAGPSKFGDFSFEKANAAIAQVCLTYLSHPAFGNFLVQPLNVADATTSYPFLEYATLYWVHHVSKAEKHNLKVQALIKDFFASPNAFVWLDAFLPALLSQSCLPPPPGRTTNSARFFYLFILKSRIVNYFSEEEKATADEQISTFLRESFEEALLNSQSKDGPNSPLAIRRMMDLAQIYGWLPGLRIKVEPLLEEALSISSKSSDHELKNLAMDVQQALADDYKRGGKYKEAQELLENLILTAENLDGSDPRIAIALDSLGWVCMRLNQFPKAASYLERALNLVTKEQGSTSPQTLRPKITLAEVLTKLNRSEEAEVLCAELISQVKEHRTNGSALPKDSISQLNTLAAVYVQRGKWKDAVETYNVVVEDRKGMFGEEDPLTMWATMQLGKAMEGAGESDLARNLFEVLLLRQKKVLGDEHPDVNETEKRLIALKSSSEAVAT